MDTPSIFQNIKENLNRARLECVPRIQKQDKLREARKQKRKKHLDEIDFPSLLEHFQVPF